MGSFFTQGVIRIWNERLEVVIKAGTIAAFKRYLEKLQYRKVF